jgi:hypothetical protein
VTHAFGEVAVAADDEGVMVRDVAAEARSQPPLGDGHADGVGESLSERSRGDLDAGGAVDFGMAGGDRVPLTEGAQVVEFDAEAGEVQHRVLQYRGVAGAEHEPITVGPMRRRGVVGHDPAEKNVRQGSEGHRRALMARPCRMGCVHGEPPDDLDCSLVERLRSAGRRSGWIGHGMGLRLARRRRRATIEPSGGRAAEMPETPAGIGRDQRRQGNRASDAVKPWRWFSVPTGPISPAQNMPASAGAPRSSWAAAAS